jgi:hypothetical protein
VSSKTLFLFIKLKERKNVFERNGKIYFAVDYEKGITTSKYIKLKKKSIGAHYLQIK